VAEDNAASLKTETVKVAMKYDLIPFTEQYQSDRWSVNQGIWASIWQG
jgi:hypothetical protein